MDQKLFEELKEKLEKEKGSIQKELETFAEADPKLKNNWNTKYPNREDGDKEDEAEEVQEYENMLPIEHSLELKLRDVATALEKIKTDKYGLCESCGKEIEEERLLAVPEAKLCLKCNNNKQ